MKNTEWIIKEKKEFEKFEGIDEKIQEILFSRGIKNFEEMNKFLFPNLSYISNPLWLKDIEKSIEIIEKAIKENKKITIYGDYDVDGITSTTTLFRGLFELGIKKENLDYYIPTRDEGYGINFLALNKIKANGTDLIITVDCGITSTKEIEYANNIGLDVIVTDHHEILGELPNALAVINCKREDNKYKFKGLCGAGTVFMLLYAYYEKKGIKEKIFDLLDLVSIGTIADIVPLLEENRIFVKFGLQMILNSKLKGLRYICSQVFDKEKEELNTYDIGFILGPVFNASGRLGDAKDSIKLLLSDDNREIERISLDIIKKNNLRKDLQNNIVNLAKEKIEKSELKDDLVLVVSDKRFHHGIMGISASKILEEYYKPVILLEEKENGESVGSCRSIENFNIVEALKDSSDLLIKYGGHSAAAGLSIKTENIESFRKKINEYAKKKLDADSLKKKIKIDSFIDTDKINKRFVEKISLLEPFGMNNPAPIFGMRNIKLSDIKKIGKDKTHLMFEVSKGFFKSKNSIWWNSVNYFDTIKENINYNIAFKLKNDNWNGYETTKIYVEDIQKDNVVSKENEDKINIEVLKIIKNFLLKDKDYQKESKKILSDYFKNNKKIYFDNLDENVFFEVLSTIAMYHKAIEQKKSIILSNQNIKLFDNQIIKRYFSIKKDNDYFKEEYSKFIFDFDLLKQI